MTGSNARDLAAGDRGLAGGPRVLTIEANADIAPVHDRQMGVLTRDQRMAARIEALIARNLEIHDAHCFNLNPATNVLNLAAEAVLSRGLGNRPSLG